MMTRWVLRCVSVVYTLWVVYCFIHSIYDRTTNFWWPYIFNLILERANKTRDSLKRKTT
jgi:hypothetical protein